MDRRVYLLALAPLAFGTGAFGFTAVLEPLAADLEVTLGEAGQVASALAVTLALTAPVLAALTAGVERRRLLVIALVLYAAACALCALAPDYPWLIGLRVGAGLAGGLIGPGASVIAAGLVPPERRGQALATVGAGVSLSFLIGSPLSAVAGDALGWRAAFGVAALLALAVAGLLRGVLPPVRAAVGGGGLGAMRVALRPEILPGMLSTLGLFAATQVTIAYLAPVARLSAGVTGGAVGVLQACIGLGSLAGLVVGGRAAGRAGRSGLPLFFSIVVLTQAGYSVLLLSDVPHAAGLAILPLLILIGAAALFGAGPVIQARLMAAAGPAAPVALALNMSMVFLGQGLGAALGGLIVDRAGLAWIGAGGAGVALIGLVHAVLSDRRLAPKAPVAAPTPAS